MKYFGEIEFLNLDFGKDSFEKGEYEFCTFKNCNFSDYQLTNYRFIECKFIECNLSNCILYETSFQDIRMKQCKLLGLQFDTCNSFNFSIKFEECNLNHSNFTKMKLTKSSFQESILQEVDFTYSDLRNTSVYACDLKGAIFEESHLEKTDFRKSVNYDIDTTINHIKGAQFSYPEVLNLLRKYDLQID